MNYSRKAKILLFLSVTFFLSVTINIPAQKIQQIINEGIVKEKEGRIDEAIKDYKEFVEKHPGDLAVTIRLMNLLLREKRYSEIISVYSNLTLEIKKRREIATMLTKAYVFLGKKEDGVNVLKGVISKEGASDVSYLFAGNLMLSLGLIEEAKMIFLEGKRRWGEKRFSRELYLCYINGEEYREAIREIFLYYEYRKVSKDWVKREIKKLLKKDESLYQELEEVTGDDLNSKQLVGEIFLEIGDIVKAKTYFLQTLDTPSLLNFASICIKKGYYQETEELLKEIIEGNAKKKEKEEAQYLLSLAYGFMLQFDNAIESLDDVIKHGIFLKDSAIVEKARILIYNKKEFEKGVKVIEPLLKKGASLNRDKILKISVTGYIKSGNFEKAEDLLEKSLKSLSFYLLGEIKFLKSSYSESRDAFLTAVSKGLDKDFANNALEKVLMIEMLQEKPSFLSFISDIEEIIWKEDYDKAITLINEAFSRFSEKEEKVILLFYKGKIYTLIGQLNDAISSYKSITGEDKDSPFSPKALYKSAILYKREIKETSMAEELLREIIFEYPESVEAELSRSILNSE